MTAVSRSETVARLSALPRPVLWVIAARIKTLGLSLAPVAAGSWLAASMGQWRGDVTLAAMGAAAAIQIGTNLWNDAADAQSGVDGPARLGPPRLTSLGVLDAPAVRRAAAGAFGISALPGLYLALIGGWPIILVGLVSLALGYFYSMGPRPLSGTPLGELLVIAFFGVVAVAGTVWLHGHTVSGTVLALGGITGLPAAAVLLLNNHRDRDSDARAGRRTLAILVGQGVSKAIFTGLILATVIGAGMFGANLLTLAPAILIGLGLCAAMIRWPVSSALNRLIPATAVFQVLVLFAIALG